MHLSYIRNCTPVLPRRLHAVAVLRFGKVDALFRLLPLCQRAVRYQMARGRLSQPVASALIAAIGERSWRFVCGEVDELRDDGVDHAAH